MNHTDTLFAKIVELAKGTNDFIDEKDGVVLVLARSLDKTTAYVSMTLNTLVAAGRIEKFMGRNSIGRGRLITHIQIKKAQSAPKPGTANMAAMPINHTNAAQAKTIPAPQTQTPAESASVPNFEISKGAVVAVLVDYDNVNNVSKLGKSISFTKMRDFCRTFGRIIFADIFLSPTSARRPEVITMLWQSGFEVFVCPMQTKDKDAVDTKLKTRARKYAEYSAASKIVIISDDGDFSRDPELSEFVKDLGKEIVIVSPTANYERFAGSDELPSELSLSRKANNFAQALEMLNAGITGLTPEDEFRTQFVKNIIEAALSITSDRTFSFKTLQNTLWGHLNDRWRQSFTIHDVKSAMTALVSKEVLQPVFGKAAGGTYGQDFTYYIVNRQHPVALLVLTSEMLSSASPS